MKFVLIIVLVLASFVSHAEVAETIYENFDGGLRIREPFQMECNIQDRHYILFVNAGESRIKVLEDSEWVKPYQVRFSPDSLLVIFGEEFTDIDHATNSYGFVLGNIRFNYDRPIRAVYRDFIPGQTRGNPYVEIPHACDFIEE